MKTKLRKSLNSLHLSDIYSLMLFVLYKVQEIPEYALVSELCFLLDGSNLTRLLTYFAGKTVTFPTEKEMALVSNAMLLYQYINLDGMELPAAQKKLEGLTATQKQKVTDLYLKLIPIMKNYNIDRSQLQVNEQTATNS